MEVTTLLVLIRDYHYFFVWIWLVSPNYCVFTSSHFARPWGYEVTQTLWGAHSLGSGGGRARELRVPVQSDSALQQIQSSSAQAPNLESVRGCGHGPVYQPWWRKWSLNWKWGLDGWMVQGVSWWRKNSQGRGTRKLMLLGNCRYFRIEGVAGDTDGEGSRDRWQVV